MSVINVQNLTKDYGAGKGIFDVNLQIEQGQMVGFAGTNGSGKTTTIRSLMGFIQPTSGLVTVNDLESWHNASKIAKMVGYVPGEIAFPDLPTGTAFLHSQAEFLGIKDMSYANQLVEQLQLDPRANLKRMSKGMKQKTALVAALMKDAPIIVLDEPTTGLDPLMRVTFLDIIKAEHKRGKTIFMSSHMFDELESTCDKVALIDKGSIVTVADMADIRNRPTKKFKVEFSNAQHFASFCALGYNVVRTQPQYNQATVQIDANKTGALLNSLSNFAVKFVAELPYTLEQHFNDILNEGVKNV